MLFPEVGRTIPRNDSQYCKTYTWHRLLLGCKNSPNVYQSAVMDVLNGLGVTNCIHDVFLVDDTEGKHVDKLQKIIERSTVAGLKLNLKRC